MSAFEIFLEIYYIILKQGIMKNSTTQTKANSKKKKEITLLQAIEKIVEVAKDSKFDKLILDLAGDEIKFLAKKFNISETQAVLFCAMMQRGPRNIVYYDITAFFDINNIRALTYANDIKALISRGILKYKDDDEDCFYIPSEVIKDLTNNKVYIKPKKEGLDIFELFDILNQLFEEINSKNSILLIKEIIELLDTNKDLDFSKKIKSLKLNSLDMAVLLNFCHLLINEEDSKIIFNQMEPLFPTRASFNVFKKDMRSGNHILFKKKLVEHVCIDGIANTSTFTLTEYAIKTLLLDFSVDISAEKIAETLKPESLTEKSLFYSNKIEKQVNELTKFFEPEQYEEIYNRMLKEGFRSGFTALFYGGPGTGKTETVYQLARKTGREILVVEVPQIKSKWVGESEKNIKALFDDYRKLVELSKVAPILFFNEADALIGTRKSGATNAVDKMENSIQNIILQEMENLNGIMIATTNLEINLDPAFERRFLYKIKFEKPDNTVRQKIWQQMIPSLTEKETEKLSLEFDFSGGQIENIARKFTINKILYGESEDNINTLVDLCSTEHLNSKRLFRVGF